MKVFYGSVFIEGETMLKAGLEHPIKLEYYKMINAERQAKFQKHIYGIDIIKTEYKESKVVIEEKELKNLSYDEEKIDKVLKLFKKNIVTPITAQYITEDLKKQII